MPPIRISGHARLKKALILRDALAAELGLDLPRAMPQLYNVEDNAGASRALDEGRYLEALASLCLGDQDRLARLDVRVRSACGRVKLAPRYAQYLALLLFAHWHEAQRDDREALLARLNARLGKHPPEQETQQLSVRAEVAKYERKAVDLDSFTEEDLQMAAFWMATAAGKTHILHACLALLDGDGWDRVFIVAPSESLTRQHADKLRELREWEVFAYPFDGDMAALGRLSPESVTVIDINKLTDAKKGDGLTIPTPVFQEGRNLVFVDEGHKGQRSEAGAWKKLQQDLAGIGAPEPRRRGLLVEFSATFGQVAEAEHAFSRYAKSIVFDYAYDRFHADLYGKDFWHVKLDGRGDAGPAAYRQTLTAALVAYWRQLAAFQSGESRKLADGENLRIAKPLWVLLGLSVIGGKTKSDQEQTSDVVDVLRYLFGILHGPEHLAGELRNVLEVHVDGADLLPPEARQALAGYGADGLAERILSDVFGWQRGDRPVFRLLKNANGELGLGLLRADETRYFGVVNVGDAMGLKKALENTRPHPIPLPNTVELSRHTGMDRRYPGCREAPESRHPWSLGSGAPCRNDEKHLNSKTLGPRLGVEGGLVVEEDALSTSLFEALAVPDSPLNLLIGSRRFAEGWDNYRASSLTLLRLGQGEGSLIIQMFGRVVRFAGRGGDGRRMRNPPNALKPLQTAYVYGLRSKYLEAFLSGLYENGVPKIREQVCPFIPTLPEPNPLRSVETLLPPPSAFTVELAGNAWLGTVNRVTLSLGATVEVSSIGRDGMATDQGKAGQDITGSFKARLPVADFDAVYREMLRFKQQQRWWNFTFDASAVRAALHGENYRIFGLPSVLQLRSDADLARFNRIAATVVRRLFENAYRKREAQSSSYRLIEAEHSGIPPHFRKAIQE